MRVTRDPRLPIPGGYFAGWQVQPTVRDKLLKDFIQPIHSRVLADFIYFMPVDVLSPPPLQMPITVGGMFYDEACQALLVAVRNDIIGPQGVPFCLPISVAHGFSRFQVGIRMWEHQQKIKQVARWPLVNCLPMIGKVEE